MYNQLTIEGDPTIWILKNQINSPDLTQTAAPFDAAITGPRAGTLLLSCRAVASVLLSSPGVASPTGPIWTDDKTLQISWLYLPTDKGLSQNSPGYALPAGTNVADIQADITTAMTTSTFATITLSGGLELVLNGATLPFAAILPATTAG